MSFNDSYAYWKGEYEKHNSKLAEFESERRSLIAEGGKPPFIIDADIRHHSNQARQALEAMQEHK